MSYTDFSNSALNEKTLYGETQPALKLLLLFPLMFLLSIFLCIWQAGSLLLLTIASRVSYLFTYKENTPFKNAIQTIWSVIFIIPLIVETIIETIILYTIKAIGEMLEFFFACLGVISIIWLPFGHLLGLLYVLIGYAFYAIFVFLTLPHFFIERKNKKEFTYEI